MTHLRTLLTSILVGSAALFAPLLGGLLPGARDAPFRPPDAEHLLGTDAMGKDVLGQLLIHAPATFAVPALAALILAVLGSVLGVLLGLGPAPLRSAILRAGDVFLIIPPIVLTLVIVLGFGATPASIVIAVVLAGLVMFLRVLSSATVQVSHSGYVEAAIGVGDSPLRIAVRDMLPELIGIVIAETSLRFLAAIQLVAALSFLGFAAGLGNSWARAIRDNITGFPLNPWATLAPGLALVISVALIAMFVERAGNPEEPS